MSKITDKWNKNKSPVSADKMTVYVVCPLLASKQVNLIYFLFQFDLLLTFFCISRRTAVGGGDPCQAVGPVEGARTAGQGGTRVGRGGRSAECGNRRDGGERRCSVALRKLRGWVRWTLEI